MLKKEGTFWQGMKFRIHNLDHKGWVSWYCLKFAGQLLWRAVMHDWSKSSRLEARGFGCLLPLLKESTYGKDNYQKLMDELQPVLDHHYKHNRHHPEHFKVGLSGMTLLDFTEMWCDWQASVRKHEDGNIFKSVEHNCGRFKMDEQVLLILRNTAVAQYDNPPEIYR